MKILIHLITLALLIYAGNVYAGRDKTIIAFGDSVTIGAWENDIPLGNGTRTGGYEPDLEALTDLQRNHYDVLNYGNAGEKTVQYSDKKGGYWRLVQDVLPFHPNAGYVLILEGTNDYWTGVSRETTRDFLGYMVDACRAYEIEPVLATLTPDTTHLKGPIKQIPLYNILITQLAIDKAVTLVDLYTPMIDEWESKYAWGPVPWDETYLDYLHLNRVGYHKMAELWFEKLDIPYIPSLTWLQLLLK